MESLKDSLQKYGPFFKFSFSFSFHLRFYMGNWNDSATHLNLTSIENEKENWENETYVCRESLKDFKTVFVFILA